MANLRGAILAVTLSAGCTAMQAPPATASPGDRLPADSISFEINSWGYPMESFRIASDGSGEYRKAAEFRAAPQVHPFRAGPAGFARIRAALAGIERYAAHTPACGSRATDFPYGQIVWQAGTSRATLSFDVGCQGPEMQRVVAAAHEAARIAEQLSQTSSVR